MQTGNKLLINRKEETLIGSDFRHSVGADIINERTYIKLSIDDTCFCVKFECLDNPFVEDNYYTEDNSEMWNQEVFEVFIANGTKDPTDYLEIEINPNNALFVAKMNNPDYIGSSLSAKFIDTNTSGIIHNVEKGTNFWKGELKIPLKLIQFPDSDINDNFRINFYRIILQEKQEYKNWKCSEKNSTFACWCSTDAENAAFHRTKYFGSMKIK